MQQVQIAVTGGVEGETGLVDRALAAVRAHLGMEVAYLSEFVDGRSVFRAVDAPGFEAMAHVGASMSLDDVYCQHILDGRLPELIADTAEAPLALAMPITQMVPIGAHVSIPIRRPDGSPFGMFCCLSRTPNPSLNARDLEIMRMFADLAAGEINGAIAERAEREAVEARVTAALAGGGFAMAYQPIFDLGAPRPSGFEALTRFAIEPRRGPDVWFAEAASVGREVDLELATIRAGLDALAALPRDVYVSVNAGPATAIDPGLYDLLRAFEPERIVLELIEHAAIACYAELGKALEPIRFLGVKLAIDDAGAGYSGLQHIVRLRPDILKLDVSLTRGIETDPAKRSLAAAMMHFARETRALIVAEGIETEAEHATLRRLGIHRGQGYLLGRPLTLDAAAALCETGGMGLLRAG